MTEFILNIDSGKFHSTNSMWNELMLNDPWSVGYVTTLIEANSFLNKEEWEAFYYESGLERESLLSKLGQNEQEQLNNELLVKQNKNIVDRLSYDIKNLNYQYGRTRERLQKKGEILFESVKSNGYNLTVHECYECVRFRVICETWNGVVVRERNTIITLKRYFPNYTFVKVSGEIDHKYAVDYELYLNGRLIAAIQIKPKSYLVSRSPYVQKAKYANSIKNKLYFDEYHVKVYDVFSDTKGNLVNEEEIKKNLT